MLLFSTRSTKRKLSLKLSHPETLELLQPDNLSYSMLPHMTDTNNGKKSVRLLKDGPFLNFIPYLNNLQNNNV